MFGAKKHWTILWPDPLTKWSPTLLLASVPWTPAQRAWVAPFQQATAMRIVFNDVSSFSNCAHYNPTTKPTAASKGVQNTKPHCSLHKVTSGTTATQFTHGTGAMPYSHCQNNTASKHLGLPIHWPMPSTGAFWTWDDRICLSLHEAVHSQRGTQPCGPGSGIWPITQASPILMRSMLQRSLGPLLF